ncbi:MAG: hypothetical protein NTV06_09950 [candidate division Zixibacteria bacterium]|nr:hypothetical protein [candidate division Zixibacteria bacterium]
MKQNTKKLWLWLILGMIGLSISCGQKNPPRDEIPIIKDLLAKFEQSIKDRNASLIDSLFLTQIYDRGYASKRVLAAIYDSTGEGGFYAFGKREFLYTKNIGLVICRIMADSADSGRPVEITLEKVSDYWLIRGFDLK